MGKYLELEFQFRTSELNGVLLSVSEPNGFPALSIELFDGRVSISNMFWVGDAANKLTQMFSFSFVLVRPDCNVL